MEIMISESQERMVAVVRPTMLDAVHAVCERWELPCTVIGEVTETRELRAFHEGEELGAIPAAFLTDEAPRYEVPRAPRPALPASPPPQAPPHGQALLELLASPNVRSRAWVFRRYDHLVGSRTLRRPASTRRCCGCGPRCAASPSRSTRRRAPGASTRGRAARSPCSRRAERRLRRRPAARADGLPQLRQPGEAEIAWELAEAIEGMALAAEALGTPVVSGNVSLYNETDGRPIDPTPVVGCVGLVEDVRAVRAAGARATSCCSPAPGR